MTECDASFGKIICSFYKDAKCVIHDCQTELSELTDVAKYAAFVEKYGDGTIGDVFVADPDGMLAEDIIGRSEALDLAASGNCIQNKKSP